MSCGAADQRTPGCCSPPPAAEPRRPGLRLILAIVLAGNCMALSLAVNISELAVDERRWLHGALLALTAAVALLVGGALFHRVVTGWRRGAASIEAVFLMGISGASAVSLHSVWAGGGDVYFEVVCILLVIYAISSAVKQGSQARTLKALQEALPSPPRATRVSPGGRTSGSVPVAELRTGDHVLVQAGEDMPVDGVVVAGAAYVNEATLTGEGACVSRGPGDAVRAGTRNVDGPLRVRATRGGAARELDRIADQVFAGLSGRAAVEAEVDRLARWFAPAVAAASCGTFAAWWLLGTPTQAFLNAMSVLLVACPCSLGFATPIGLWTAWVELTRLGLVPRDTAGIERLAGADTIVFDKTGTLSHMELSAGRCRVMPGVAWTEAQALDLASVAQTLSEHPIARAFARPQSGAYRPDSVRPLPGRGIEVQVVGSTHGQRWCLWLGDPRRMATPVSAELEQALAALRRGVRPLALFVDGCAVALFELVERPVAQAARTLDRLASMGLSCSVCSGDIEGSMQAWLSYRPMSLMTAAGKARHVRELEGQGHRVCFVGDGVNDAPALAQSHVGLAIASGARLATLAADFTLAQAALPRLPDAIAIARRAMQTVRSNLALAAAYNALGIGLAATGGLHPVLAAALMLCSSFTVTWRASTWVARERASQRAGD